MVVLLGSRFLTHTTRSERKETEVRTCKGLAPPRGRRPPAKFGRDLRGWVEYVEYSGGGHLICTQGKWTRQAVIWGIRSCIDPIGGGSSRPRARARRRGDPDVSRGSFGLAVQPCSMFQLPSSQMEVLHSTLLHCTPPTEASCVALVGTIGELEILRQRVVRERTPGPSCPQTPAGGLST